MEIPTSTHDGLCGWITPLLGTIVRLVSRPNRRILGKRVPQDEKAVDLMGTARRARMVDTYIAVWIAIEIASFGWLSVPFNLHWSYRIPCVALVAWRALEIVAEVIRISLFDRHDVRAGQRPAVASHVRMVVLGMVNYLELAFCFGVIYSFRRELIRGEDIDWFSPLHLSIITQFTIGYGDLRPKGWLRPLACLQGSFAFVLVFLLIARFIALLKPELDVEQWARAAHRDRARVVGKEDDEVSSRADD